jgi:pimeloyl-ACP methyl ester carboxylesterase
VQPSRALPHVCPTGLAVAHHRCAVVTPREESICMLSLPLTATTSAPATRLATLATLVAALNWPVPAPAQPATPASAPATATVAATSAAMPVSKAYTVVKASLPCQQTTCDAELWLPLQPAGAPKPAVIIMAHGFGALKEWGLPAFAERFVAAGFAVLRFDYRGFGRSGGQPRRVVDGKEHVKDWLSVIDAVSKRPDVDGNRLGIWGSSYSGGQVLVAGAERPGVVKAVSAQVPFVNGLSSSLQFPLKYHPLAGWYALRDMLRSDTQEPLYVPTIAAGAFSALICDECAQGYKTLVPAGASEAENRVAARVFLTLPFFNPGSRAKDIQAPTLIIAADNDGLIPVAKVRETAQALPHGEYLELKGANHFSPYTGPLFEQVVRRQTAFFVKNLLP